MQRDEIVHKYLSVTSLRCSPMGHMKISVGPSSPPLPLYVALGTDNADPERACTDPDPTKLALVVILYFFPSALSSTWGTSAASPSTCRSRRCRRRAARPCLAGVCTLPLSFPTRWTGWQTAPSPLCRTRSVTVILIGPLATKAEGRPAPLLSTPFWLREEPVRLR